MDTFDAQHTALADYVQSAKNAWPQLALSDERFVSHISKHWPRWAEGELPPVIFCGDLYLASACSLSVATAVEAFHRTYAPVIARVLTRRHADSPLAEDAAQQVFTRLLVGQPEEPARIGSYRGNGPLKSWVSTTAATTWLMLQRAQSRRRENFADDQLLAYAGHDNHELVQIAEQHRPLVEDVIARALGSLDERERTLLRLQVAEHMSIDRLAVVFGVNRATAARWLVRAREKVLQLVRGELRLRLQLDSLECDSMLRLVHSGLNVSVLRHLA